MCEFNYVTGGGSAAVVAPRCCSAADVSGRRTEDEADDGDDGRIVLDRAFETERVVIGAAGATGIFTTRFGAGFVNGATTRFWVEKLARFSEKRVFGAFEDARAIGHFRVLARGLFDGNSKMRRQPLDIGVGNFDSFVDRTAKGNAFGAIVLKTRFLTSHGFVSRNEVVRRNGWSSRTLVRRVRLSWN
jgi:hypothetical protein